MLRLLNFSIVVVAGHHNPTILNPDFLARNHIVPDDWGWRRTDDCFSTPPLARVTYDSDVTLLCEPSKLQVVHAGDRVDPADSRIDQIAVAYLRTLPHVRYTGLGVNFKAMMPIERPSGVLINRFLKPGPWCDPDHRLDELGLRMTRAIEGGWLRIALDAGEVNSPDADSAATREAIIAGANFHHDLTDASMIDQASRIVGRKSAYWDRFKSDLATMMDLDPNENKP